MKNRMDVPQEYEPVLPGKVEAHLAKKKAQETDQDSLLTQTAIAVGKVIMQLELVNRDRRREMSLHPQFNSNSRVNHLFHLTRLISLLALDLSPDELRDLKSACLNHLSHLIPGIEKESIDDWDSLLDNLAKRPIDLIQPSRRHHIERPTHTTPGMPA